MSVWLRRPERASMATQPKPPSRILQAVHETAADLHKLGLIDSRRMQRYDALCQKLEPPTDADKVEAVTNCDPCNAPSAAIFLMKLAYSPRGMCVCCYQI